MNTASPLVGDPKFVGHPPETQVVHGLHYRTLARIADDRQPRFRRTHDRTPDTVLVFNTAPAGAQPRRAVATP